MYPERHIGSRGESRGETISGLPASRWSRAAWRVSGRALGRWGDRSAHLSLSPGLFSFLSILRLGGLYTPASHGEAGAFPSKTAADAPFC